MSVIRKSFVSYIWEVFSSQGPYVLNIFSCILFSVSSLWLHRLTPLFFLTGQQPQLPAALPGSHIDSPSCQQADLLKHESDQDPPLLTSHQWISVALKIKCKPSAWHRRFIAICPCSASPASTLFRSPASFLGHAEPNFSSLKSPCFLITLFCILLLLLGTTFLLSLSGKLLLML